MSMYVHTVLRAAEEFRALFGDRNEYLNNFPDAGERDHTTSWSAGFRLPLKASVCVLPAVADGEEDMAIEHIMPELKQGHDAVHAACAAYADLHIRDGYSQKSARRTTGVLWCTTIQMREFSQLVTRLVTSINQHKESIQRHIIENYGGDRRPEYMRFNALHSACPVS